MQAHRARRRPRPYAYDESHTSLRTDQRFSKSAKIARTCSSAEAQGNYLLQFSRGCSGSGTRVIWMETAAAMHARVSKRAWRNGDSLRSGRFMQVRVSVWSWMRGVRSTRWQAESWIDHLPVSCQGCGQQFQHDQCDHSIMASCTSHMSHRFCWHLYPNPCSENLTPKPFIRDVDRLPQCTNWLVQTHVNVALQQHFALLGRQTDPCMTIMLLTWVWWLAWEDMSTTSWMFQTQLWRLCVYFI